jgi:hypothetical protein
MLSIVHEILIEITQKTNRKKDKYNIILCIQ